MLGRCDCCWAKAAVFAPTASAAPPDAAFRKIVRRVYVAIMVFCSMFGHSTN
jgi:hypothetical protein